MFSGQGGAVYAEMALKWSWRAGGAVWALGNSVVSSRLSTYCRDMAKWARRPHCSGCCPCAAAAGRTDPPP